MALQGLQLLLNYNSHSTSPLDMLPWALQELQSDTDVTKLEKAASAAEKDSVISLTHARHFLSHIPIPKMDLDTLS